MIVNIVVVEIVVKIYYGVFVLLDRIFVNGERVYWDNVMMILILISSFYCVMICGEKFVGLVIRLYDFRLNFFGLFFVW